MEQKFLIGQRVIVAGEIMTVIKEPVIARAALGMPKENRIWVRDCDGVNTWRAIENVKPLPNGQL